MVDMDMVDMDMDIVDMVKQGLGPKGSSVDSILSFFTGRHTGIRGLPQSVSG